MNISGVLVRSRPENIDAVWKSLEQVDGVEVHGANPDGRLVVTVEETSDQDMADTVVRLQDLPRVIAVSMIYHEFEKGTDGTDEESVNTSAADSLASQEAQQ